MKPLPGDMSATQKYGWFSVQMYERYGYVIYQSDRGPVQVTCLSTSATESPTMWADDVCVGPVGAFLESHTRSVRERREEKMRLAGEALRPEVTRG